MATTIEYRKHRAQRQPIYRLLTKHVVNTGIRDYAIETPGGGVTLNKKGVLTIRPGYWWDGPSGTVRDTGREMLWSLVHDALYDLLREGGVVGDEARHDFRLATDNLMYWMMLQSGVPKGKAKTRYLAVRKSGERYTNYLAANEVRSHTYEDLDDGWRPPKEAPPLPKDRD